MKLKTLLGLCLFAPIALAQTVTPVTPTIANGQIQVTVMDSSGAPHYVSLPYLLTLSMGTGTDTYTPPVVIVPPPPPPPPPPPSGAPAIPSNAVAVDLINPSSAWKNTKDAGTPGTATFSNNYPVTGIFADDARAFSIAYSGAAGVRFSNSFAKDTVATNFVYDTVVQSPDWTHTANLEMDTNQVRSDGKTYILGTQCSSYSHSWEVTLINPSTGKWHWVPTNAYCDPTKWTPNVPHHIRIFGTIAASGISTYAGAELDEVYATFTGASGATGRALGWSIGSVLDNFQIDGLGLLGTATVYSDKLTIIRW